MTYRVSIPGVPYPGAAAASGLATEVGECSHRGRRLPLGVWGRKKYTPLVVLPAPWEEEDFEYEDYDEFEEENEGWEDYNEWDEFAEHLNNQRW